MTVHVHIRELVLHGLPPARREAVADEVRRAIEAQLAHGARWRTAIDRDVVHAGAFSWNSGAPAELTAGLAGRVAQAVLP